MKRVLVLMIIGFFTFTSFLLAEPKIEIEGGNTYSWGKVKPKNNPLNAKIKIFNRGTDTLKITGVKPGCGCTTAPLDKYNIPPGDYATLAVTLNLGSYKGPVTKSISITCNDPANTSLYLFISAEVVFDVVFSAPEYLNMGDMELKVPKTASITMTNVTDSDITIKNFSTNPPSMKLSIENGTVIPSKGTLELTGTVQVDVAGSFYGSILMNTDNPDQPQLNLSVRGNVKEAPKTEVIPK